jgi:hypothetical protein
MGRNFLGATCGLLGLIAFLLGVGSKQQSDLILRIRTEAIERGHAQFCPTDGRWAWKGGCND